MSYDASPFRLAKSDIDKAVAMLSRSFADDPFAKSLLAEGNGRQSDFAKLTNLILRYGVDRGEVYAVSPDLEGVAVWFPPSSVSPSLWDMARYGMFFLPFSVRWHSFRLVMTYQQHAAMMQKQFLRNPHWYLQLLGVDPHHQGKGCAGFLLRSMLDRLDRERTACCLDTTNEKNVALYEHFGFRVLRESRIPIVDCVCWFMERESTR